MKIVIIHDDFSVFGGGEKMMFELASELNADIITFSLDEKVKKILNKYSNKPKIITLKREKDKDNEEFQAYRFSKLNLKKQYDFFIFSGHQSISAAKNNKPNSYYINHIPRFILQNKNKEKKYFKKTGFNLKDILIKSSLIKKKLIQKEIPSSLQKLINNLAIKISIRNNPEVYKEIISKTKKDLFIENLNYVNKIITNSKNIQTKVRNLYKKESKVIHPFIETKKYNNKKSKDFWLSINRVVQHKRIEIQIKAFSKLPEEKLVIVGQIEDENYYHDLLKIKPDNVKFLGLVEEENKINLLSRCKGVIFTGFDEDFGLVPIEAMASGKPIIASKEGGIKETVTDQTGILIENITSDKLVEAIKEVIRNQDRFTKYSIKKSKLFDKNLFVKNMKKEIKYSKKQSDLSKLKIRKYLSGDEKKLVKLYNEIFVPPQKKMTLDHWNWKYKQNPYGFEIFVVENKEKEVVGQFCNQIKKGTYFGKEFLYTNPVDIGIKKDYRKMGFLREMYNRPEKRKFLVIGFPNEEVVRHYKKNKLDKNMIEIPLFRKKIITRNEILNKLEWGAINSTEIKEKENMGRELNKLWKEKEKEIEIGIKRDFKYIKWRFLDNPSNTKTFILRKKEKIIGYFVLLKNNKKVKIIDILVLNKFIGKELIKEIEKVSQKFNGEEISILLKDKTLEKILRKENYSFRKKVCAYNVNNIDGKEIKNIYITFSDTDFF